MTRKEEIEQAAIKIANGYYGVHDKERRVAYSFFCDGAEWADKNMIERACEWLKKNMHDYYEFGSEFATANGCIKRDEFIENFKKEMTL